MDDTRAIKRRKIATEIESAAGDATDDSVSIASTATPNSTEPAQASNKTQALSVAQQIWREARAKSRGYAKRAKTAETADDGDTITVGRIATPVQSIQSDVKQGTGKVGRPRKVPLDPLRNQQQQQVNGTLSKKSSTVDVKGFFKRFHNPEPKPLAVPVLHKTLPAKIRPTGRTSPDSELHVSESEDELAGSQPSAQSPIVKKLFAEPAHEQVDSHPTSYTKQLDRRKPGGIALTGESIFRPTNGASGKGAFAGDPVSIVVQASTPQRLAVKPVLKRSWPVVHFDQPQIACIRRVVLEKITRKRPTEIIGLTDEYGKVASLVKQTVTAGESNSMLIIGPRGSGKSALVEQCIREQTKTHANDFHVVRLNGFLHTDDRIALREIWRQLGREMDLNEDENSIKNYADTLTTLLALLSHPTETAQPMPGQIARSVLFIIDEFDLFAGHPRQTLLYNLFDIAQSRKAPIAVIGLTTRIDVAESLEKRVKSRFSHRYVYLGLPRTYEAFEKLCKTALSVLPEDLDLDEKKVLSVTSDMAQKLSASSTQSGEIARPIQDWGEVVEEILTSDSISPYFRRLYYTTKSLPDFFTAMTLPFSTLATSESMTSTAIVEHFAQNFEPDSTQTADSKLDLLPALSNLQLALLVCAARLSAIYNSDVLSFVLVYEEYKTIASKTKLQASAAGALAQGAGGRVWNKDVARGAWEALLQWELIIEDGRAGGGSGRVDVGLEELAACGVDLGMWARWCREI